MSLEEVGGANGQAANSFSGGRENCIGDGGRDGRDAGFADAAGALVVFDDMDFDDRRSVVHAQDFVIVEIVLVDAAVRDRDFAFESLREAKVDSALHLSFDAEWIDAEAAIDGADDAVDMDRATF